MNYTLRFTTAFALLFFCSACSTLAQQSSQNFLPDDNYKVIRATEVFQQVGMTMKDPYDLPTLKVIAAVGHMQSGAYYSPETKGIFIQEEAYDLAMGLGADSLDALAFMLGHELTHYYGKHDFAYDFWNSYHTLDAGKRVNGATLETYLQKLNQDERETIGEEVSLARRTEQESQADHEGALYSYLAGFHCSIVVAPRMFDSLYSTLERSYGSEDALDKMFLASGYPSKHDRQAIVAGISKEFSQLLPVFEAAQNLMLAGKYEDAAECYHYIAQRYPGREMCNDEGVAYLLNAIDIGGGDVKFAYPVMLDLQTGAATKGLKGFGFGPNTAQVKIYLDKAKTAFESAIKADQDYAEAYINLACTLDLLDSEKKASGKANYAESLAEDNKDTTAVVNAKIIIAIIAAKSGDLESAEKTLDALSESSALAAVDLKRLNGDRNAEVEAGSHERLSPVDEDIMGVTPRDRSLAGALHLVHVDTALDLQIYSASDTTFQALKIKTKAGSITMLSTIPHFTGKSGRGIGVGDAASKVIEAYGSPHLTVQSSSGSYLKYDEAAPIIFDIDQLNNVRGWTLYAERD